MVRHIVWWTLKPEAEGRTAAENAKLIKQRLEALMGQIPPDLHHAGQRDPHDHA